MADRDVNQSRSRSSRGGSPLNSLQLYVIAKTMSSPLDTREKTTVFFTGWKAAFSLQDTKPEWGYPHLDGCRQMITYPDVGVAQGVLDKLPEDFKQDARILELQALEVTS